LFHLVGYLYYWQMGFNSVFKGLTKGVQKSRTPDRYRETYYFWAPTTCHSPGA